MSEMRKGKPFFRDQKDLDENINKLLNRHPLDFPLVNLGVWLKVNELYLLYKENTTSYTAAKKLGLKKGSLKGMWSKFSRGYNPTEDERMIMFLQSNNLEIKK